MHMRWFALAAAAGLVMASTTAQAGRRCDGDFELVRGAWVSTRYCRAAQIAIVGREVGFRVSAEDILRSPSKAEEICRFVGSDIRVQPACEMASGLLQLSF